MVVMYCVIGISNTHTRMNHGAMYIVDSKYRTSDDPTEKMFE